MLAFTAQRLLKPSEAIDYPLLLVDHGRVVEISSADHRSVPVGIPTRDFPDSIIAPGYIDLHIHGGAGYDVMDDREGSLTAIENLLSRHGVTAYFPTTVTAPIDPTLRALEHLANAIESADSPAERDRAPRARPLGIHLEGPFISPIRCGVHPTEHLLAPTVPIFERFWQASRGHIRMITIAPELDGALEVVSEAAHRAVCVSLGHSDADFPATRRAIDAGARHATHTFNAMRPLDHRAPGILGSVLTDDRLSADIIADGIHLDPAIVRLFAEAKGPDRAVLITDAISATGMPNGRYPLGSLEVEVHDGKCTFNGKLAGSVLTMDRAVRNLSRFAEWDLSAAVAAASRNPARVAQTASKGVLAAGADADFIVLSQSGEVQHTFVAGIECQQPISTRFSQAT
jgi:N-acetylglucosamine-6-phosphate deacetylase